jgi:hypothetical protein
MIGVAVLALRSYGGSVFLGIPFVTGLTSAVVANRIGPRSLTDTIVIGQVTLLSIAGMATLLLAGDGRHDPAGDSPARARARQGAG